MPELEPKDIPPETDATPPVVETTPPVADSTVETPPITEPHPLEPGGKRFDQVWKRAKTAEERLQDEREQRIRLEERLKVLEETKQTAETQAADAKVYTWDQLENWIADGRITRAQAAEYREELVRKQVARDADAKAQARVEAAQKTQTVNQSLWAYRNALPALTDRTSPERLRAEAEYAFLVQLHGAPRDTDQQLVYELSAYRAAFGDAGAIGKLRASQDASLRNQEGFVETGSPGKSPTGVKDDLVKGLSSREREHYERMFRTRPSMYPKGWDSVREELSWRRGGVKA